MWNWVERSRLPYPPTDGLILVSVDGKPSWTSPSLAFTQVPTYADLPDATLHNTAIYYVTTSTGIWLVNRKSRGFYRSNGISWEYGGELIDAFSASNFQVYDPGNSSKNITFNVSSLTTGRVITFADRDFNFETINNGIVILDVTCDAAVLVGDAVYLDSTGTLKQANASSMATSRVVGMVEAKSSLIACNLRIDGFTGPYLTGLVPGQAYFLSASTSGAITAAAPTGAGTVIVEVGVARTSVSAMIEPKVIAVRS